MVTMKDIINIKRKIGRCRKKETLEKYGRQLDVWIAELQTNIAANQELLESLQTRPKFRHSYSYDQFDERVRAKPIQKSRHRKYLRG